MKTYSSPAAAALSESACMCWSIFCPVFVARVFRRNFHGGFVFDIQQQHGIAELRGDFVRVEQMEHDDFVAAIAQRLDDFDDLFGIGVEIGQHDHDAAAVQKLLKVEEGLGKSVRGPPSAFSMAWSRRISWPWRVEGGT